MTRAYWTEEDVARLTGQKIPPAERNGLQQAIAEEDSELARTFDTLHQQIARDLPAFVSEHIAIDGRKFRCDRCYPDLLVAVELDGYDHTKPERFVSDVEKMNLLNLDGWCVLRATTAMMRDDPDSFFDLIRKARNFALSDGR